MADLGAEMTEVELADFIRETLHNDHGYMTYVDMDCDLDCTIIDGNVDLLALARSILSEIGGSDNSVSQPPVRKKEGE